MYSFKNVYGKQQLYDCKFIVSIELWAKICSDYMLNPSDYLLLGYPVEIDSKAVDDEPKMTVRLYE